MRSADCISKSGEGSGVVQPCKTHKGANTGGFLFIDFIYLFIFLGSSLAYLKWGVRCSCCIM